MKDLPRTILKDLVRRYGESIAQDPFRCEALLRDTCGACGREIFVLVSAVRQHVPLDLKLPRHNLPLSLMKGFMIKRLQDELGLSDEAARWAVETWAEALNLSENTGELSEKPEVSPGGTSVEDPAGVRPSPDPALLEQWAADLASGAPVRGLAAIDGLGRSGDPESIRLLIAALSNPGWRVRNGAFDALVRLSPYSVPALYEVLNNPDEALVARVVLILAAIRDRNATEPLLAILGRNSSMDKTLIFALGEIGDLRAASPLSKYLISPDPDTGLAAAGALQKISVSKTGR
jgi:hypothetical protein